MKKSILYIGLLMFVCLQTSCDDNKEQYLDDFSTILYFRDSGEIEHDMNIIEEMSTYTVSVVKAGSNNQATTAVDLMIMDGTMLTDYNNNEGTNYKVLPADCYSIETGNLSFNSSSLYQTIDVSLYTEAINAIQGDDYIIALYLSNSADSINVEKSYVFIKPRVVTPLVSFQKFGYVMNSFSESGETQFNYTLPVNLSVSNKWTFNCYTEVNEDLLDTYNREQNASYILLPENSYTIAEEGVVSMTPEGANSLKFTINKETLSFGNYILPLLLTGTSMEKIDVDPTRNSCLFGVSYVPDESSLQSIQLAENMISYYPNSICEGSVPEMYDGNPDTYYHSDWNVGLPLPHWLQFALPEDCSAFRFKYSTRGATERVTPHQITLYGSEDGVDFKKIVTIEDLPQGAGVGYTSPVFVAGGKIKHLRLSVDKSPAGSFAFTEFALWAI